MFALTYTMKASDDHLPSFLITAFGTRFAASLVPPPYPRGMHRGLIWNLPCPRPLPFHSSTSLERLLCHFSNTGLPVPSIIPSTLPSPEPPSKGLPYVSSSLLYMLKSSSNRPTAPPSLSYPPPLSGPCLDGVFPTLISFRLPEPHLYFVRLLPPSFPAAHYF